MLVVLSHHDWPSHCSINFCAQAGWKTTEMKNVGKAGSVIPSTELNPSPTPPRPKPTPIFNEIPVPASTPALSMIEEQPADSPDISATDVDADIAEGAMLTLGMREQ